MNPKDIFLAGYKAGIGYKAKWSVKYPLLAVHSEEAAEQAWQQWQAENPDMPVDRLDAFLAMYRTLRAKHLSESCAMDVAYHRIVNNNADESK